MLTGQQLDQLLDRRPRRAVARVPPDTKAGSVKILQQARDIAVHDVERLAPRRSVRPLSRGRHCPQFLNVLAKKWAMLEHQLEAVVIGGIMAAGYLYTAINL